MTLTSFDNFIRTWTNHTTKEHGRQKSVSFYLHLNWLHIRRILYLYSLHSCMLTSIFKYKINTKSDLITSSPGWNCVISCLSWLLCQCCRGSRQAIPAHLRVLNLICHRIIVFCRPCDIRDTCHGFSALSFAKMLLSWPLSRWLRVSWAPDTAAPAPGARTAGAASAPPWSWTPCRSSRTGSRPRPVCTRRGSLRASSERKKRFY